MLVAMHAGRVFVPARRPIAPFLHGPKKIARTSMSLSARSSNPGYLGLGRRASAVAAQAHSAPRTGVRGQGCARPGCVRGRAPPEGRSWPCRARPAGRSWSCRTRPEGRSRCARPEGRSRSCRALPEGRSWSCRALRVLRATRRGLRALLGPRGGNNPMG